MGSPLAPESRVQPTIEEKSNPGWIIEKANDAVIGPPVNVDHETLLTTANKPPESSKVNENDEGGAVVTLIVNSSSVAPEISEKPGVPKSESPERPSDPDTLLVPELYTQLPNEEAEEPKLVMSCALETVETAKKASMAREMDFLVIKCGDLLE